MIKNIQNILNDVEFEKESLLKENEDLSICNNHLNENNKRLKKDLSEINIKYNNIISDFEMKNIQNQEFMKENLELINKKKFLEDKIKKNDIKMNGKFLQKEEEFSFKYENLNDEKINLENRLNKLIYERSSSENLNDLQNERLNEITKKHKNYQQKFNSLEKNYNKIEIENEKLKEKNEESENLINTLKKDFAEQIQRLNLDKTNKIKEKDELIKILKTKVRQSKINLENFNNLGTNLGGLNIGENDLIGDRNSDLLDFNRDTEIDRNSFYIADSNRNLDISDNFNNEEDDLEEDLNYLTQIEAKDEEINNLRDDLFNLRKKLDKTDYKADQKLKENIKKLELELKHLQENFNTYKINSKNEINHLENENKEWESMILEIKMNFQVDISEKDFRILKMMKKIKILNYQISLYEKQISDFNNIMNKR